MTSSADMPTNEHALILKAVIETSDYLPAANFNDYVVQSLLDHNWGFTFYPHGVPPGHLCLRNSQQGRDALRRFERAQEPADV